MEDKELFARLEAILRNPNNFEGALDLSDKEIITPEMNLRNDLGLDSLDLYEFLYQVEEELGITIQDEKANEFRCLKDCMNYLRDSKQI